MKRGRRAARSAAEVGARWLSAIGTWGNEESCRKGDLGRIQTRIPECDSGMKDTNETRRQAAPFRLRFR